MAAPQRKRRSKVRKDPVQTGGNAGAPEELQPVTGRCTGGGARADTSSCGRRFPAAPAGSTVRTRRALCSYGNGIELAVLKRHVSLLDRRSDVVAAHGISASHRRRVDEEPPRGFMMAALESDGLQRSTRWRLRVARQWFARPQEGVRPRQDRTSAGAKGLDGCPLRHSSGFTQLGALGLGDFRRVADPFAPLPG